MTGYVVYGCRPWFTCTSEPHTPTRCTRSSTSSGPATGAATSRISIAPGAVITACFMGRFSARAPEPPAVDGIGRSGAVAGLRRTQEHEQGRDLFGRSKATDRRVVLGDLVEVL